MHHDDRGHPLTTDSADAAAALALAMDRFAHRDAAVAPCIKAALEADPDFALAHAANGLILHGARNVAFQPKVNEELAAAQAGVATLSPREQLYVRALQASAAGRLTGAVTAYEALLDAYPTDIFAQSLCQMELFWMGEMAWSADISARLVPHWSEDVPGYGTHLACRSFDLEETHRFGDAEAAGREAVERDPTDVWATHAVAHVLTMQGRSAEGVAWLDGLKDNWSAANQIMLHVWWHRCLFHWEIGEYDAVLDYYDRWVRNRELPLLKSMPDLYIDMQNGASMLMRLELKGLDVGRRWEELAELTLGRIDDHSSPFTSAHFAVILAATGRFEEAGRLVASMRAFAHADDGTLGARYHAAAVPAAQAAIAHRRGEHERVVEALLPARRALWQMGGSHAQRDLFFLLLADSARRLGRRDALHIILADVASAGFQHVPDRAGYREAAAAAEG